MCEYSTRPKQKFSQICLILADLEAQSAECRFCHLIHDLNLPNIFEHIWMSKFIWPIIPYGNIPTGYIWASGGEGV